MLPQLMKISKISWETEDVFTIEVEPGGKQAKPFNFKPGQFNMLYGFGTGEAAISISSDSSKSDSFLHTIHRVGYVTGFLSRLKKGDIMGVRGPFGSSWPVAEAEGKDVCIIAGGIGLAPLRPSIYHIFNNRKKYGKFDILYGARSPRDLLFRTELEQWGKKHNVNVEITVDRADSSWKGHVGVVTTIIDYAMLNPVNTIAMVCGPELMMKFCIDELLALGFPEDHVYLSMERNMKCAIGFCGHCQFGPNFICKDGPVFNYTRIKKLFDIEEL
jgi:NAD(P)H-flavin reductase